MKEKPTEGERQEGKVRNESERKVETRESDRLKGDRRRVEAPGYRPDTGESGQNLARRKMVLGRSNNPEDHYRGRVKKKIKAVRTNMSRLYKHRRINNKAGTKGSSKEDRRVCMELKNKSPLDPGVNEISLKLSPVRTNDDSFHLSILADVKVILQRVTQTQTH